MSSTPRLVAMLMYGSGLRLLEALQLRVKDLDFSSHEITVRWGKGAKDRVTMLPECLHQPLQGQLERVRGLHRRDLASGGGGRRDGISMTRRCAIWLLPLVLALHNLEEGIFFR